jgi:hypothetical protein
MYKLFLSVLIFVLLSCSKSNTPANTNEMLPSGTVLAMGSFNSNVHTTSGTVKVVREVSNKIYLLFENFKTDNGPDLRVWVSPSTTGTPYQEIGLLKAVSGNFSYELNATINYTANNRVLVWCKDFSILFGHAVLQ